MIVAVSWEGAPPDLVEPLSRLSLEELSARDDRPTLALGHMPTSQYLQSNRFDIQGPLSY